MTDNNLKTIAAENAWRAWVGIAKKSSVPVGEAVRIGFFKGYAAGLASHDRLRDAIEFAVGTLAAREEHMLSFEDQSAIGKRLLKALEEDANG